MPRGDGTGSNGEGPMTGRRLGYCAGFNMPGFMNCRFGRGMGGGFGRGIGLASRAGAMQIPVQQPVALTEEDEKKILEAELEDLKSEMKEIEKRLKELREISKTKEV